MHFGVRFTEPGGTLWLTHVEDQVTFDRIMDAIAKIDSIDTDGAREALSGQLLKDPNDYIASCREALRAAGASLTVETLVTFGHRLREYDRLIEAHQISLLVLNTNDEDQMAMRGIAYALAVELRHIPLLML